jgi:hypothetical protein
MHTYVCMRAYVFIIACMGRYVSICTCVCMSACVCFTFMLANPNDSSTMRKAMENTPLSTVTSPAVIKYSTAHKEK